MKSIKTQRGSVLVFATLMIVLLLVMVGIGLDTGWITYVRGLGQPAVDAAALAGASAIPTGDRAQVDARVAAYNTTNDYVKSGSNSIGKNNVTLIDWNSTTGDITTVSSVSYANGVRVALEQTNPYDGSSPGKAINAPLFLTPLFNLMGISMAKTTNINVSAVAVVQRLPSMPLAIAGCPPANAKDICKTVTKDGATECKLAQIPITNNSGWTSFTTQPANTNIISPMVDEPGSCKGAIPAVGVNDKICLNNGQIEQPLLKAMLDHYSKNPGPLSGEDKKPRDPEDCGVIPVVDASITAFNKCDNQIKSFARLCIRDVIVNDKGDKYVYGDLTCNQGLFNPHDSAQACYIPRLVREKKSDSCPTCAM